jgi:outer membrane protein TolC
VNTTDQKAIFAALIGFAPDTRLILAMPEPAAETISLTQATQQAVTNSPEVVEAEQTLVKAKAASRLSKLEYIPAVAVTGGYVNQPQPAIPLLPNDFSFIGAIATFNIFDFGKREKTVSERNTQVELAEANVAMVKSKVAANGTASAASDISKPHHFCHCRKSNTFDRWRPEMILPSEPDTPRIPGTS